MTDTIQTVAEVTDPRGLALLKAVGLDKLAPEQRELALNIATRYDLDLLLKHLVLIQGRAYITRDGLLHIAHRSGQLDGIETTEPHLSDGFWRASASVYRKDMSRPFTYAGRYPEKGRGNAEFAPEMAVKVAEVMALRRAFDVAAPTADERWDVPEAAVEPVAARPSLAEVAKAKAAEIVEPSADDRIAALVADAPPILATPMPLEESDARPYLEPVPSDAPAPTMSREEFKAFTNAHFIGASQALKTAKGLWPDFTWDSATPEQLADLADVWPMPAKSPPPRIRVACGGFSIGPRRYEPCVCGGMISAMPGEDAERVAIHVAEERHQQWRKGYSRTVGDG